MSNKPDKKPPVRVDEADEEDSELEAISEDEEAGVDEEAVLESAAELELGAELEEGALELEAELDLEAELVPEALEEALLLVAVSLALEEDLVDLPSIWSQKSSSWSSHSSVVVLI